MITGVPASIMCRIGRDAQQSGWEWSGVPRVAAGQPWLPSSARLGIRRRRAGSVAELAGTRAIRGYSQLTVVPCLVNGFTPRVGRRW